MKTDRQAFQGLPGIRGLLRKWALAAAIAAAGVCSLPGVSFALVNYGTMITHQSNEVNNGDTSTTDTQDRFSFFFNLIAAPASRLNMVGIFKFDVLLDKTDGTSSTEFQPNVDLHLNTRTLQTGVGYREIISDQTVLAGLNEQHLKSDDKDGYVEATINSARLPSVRLRYSLRDEKQTTDGTTNQDTRTNEFAAGMNYKIGIFTMNADVLLDSTKDRVTGITTDTTQATGQIAASKQFGPRFDMGLRENYIINLANANGVQTGNSYSSISEARANLRPFTGVAATSSYIYRISNDLFQLTGKQTENTWFSSVNYNIWNSVRLYGSFNMRQQDDQVSSTGDNTGIWGVALTRSFGRFAVSARYEGQGETTKTTSQDTGPTDITTLRTNLDWSVAARLVRFIALNVGESYVSNTVGGETTASNMFRLSANIIPVSYLSIAPTVDYTINSNPDGTEADTTQVVIPAAFRVQLHQKLDFTNTNDYRWSQNVDVLGLVSSSSSNNLLLRLTLNRPLPNTMMAVDATFQTTTDASHQTTTQSTYTARLNWTTGMQALSANAQYQTGTATANTTVSSASASAQYGLRFNLKKLLFSVQARYDYSVTFSTPQQSAQGIFLSLDMRR